MDEVCDSKIQIWMLNNSSVLVLLFYFIIDSLFRSPAQRRKHTIEAIKFKQFDDAPEQWSSLYLAPI